MHSPRFRFPSPSAEPVTAVTSGCPFVVLPAGLVPQQQYDAVRQLYQLAWERTQAALAPTKVDRAYQVSAN